MSDYKEATGNAWKPENAEDFVEGLLVKIEEKVGPNESMMYHIEQLANHEVIRVWGSTILDSRMSEVVVGKQVKITYKGLAEKGGRGKNKPKIFKVEYKDADAPDNEAVITEEDIEDIMVD